MPLRHPQPVWKNTDTLIGIDDARLRDQQTEGVRLDATNLQALVLGELS